MALDPTSPVASSSASGSALPAKVEASCAAVQSVVAPVIAAAAAGAAGAALPSGLEVRPSVVGSQGIRAMGAMGAYAELAPPAQPPSVLPLAPAAAGSSLTLELIEKRRGALGGYGSCTSQDRMEALQELAKPFREAVLPPLETRERLASVLQDSRLMVYHYHVDEIEVLKKRELTQEDGELIYQSMMAMAQMQKDEKLIEELQNVCREMEDIKGGNRNIDIPSTLRKAYSLFIERGLEWEKMGIEELKSAKEALNNFLELVRSDTCPLRKWRKQHLEVQIHKEGAKAEKRIQKLKGLHRPSYAPSVAERFEVGHPLFRLEYSHLNYCPCTNSSLRSTLTDQSLALLDGPKEKEITVVSVGAGGCYGEMVYLAKMAKLGYKKIKMVLIDKDQNISKEELMRFCRNELAGTSIEIVSFAGADCLSHYEAAAGKDPTLKPKLLLLIDLEFERNVTNSYEFFQEKTLIEAGAVVAYTMGNRENANGLCFTYKDEKSVSEFRAPIGAIRVCNDGRSFRIRE